jgi:Fe-S oxidoreductase
MINSTTFLIVFAASMLFFAYSCFSKFGLIRMGASTNRTENFSERLGSMFKDAIGQSRVIKGPFGMNHAMLFWSFLVLVLLNAEFLINGLVPSISFTLLPTGLYYILLNIFDIVSLLVLIAVTAALSRKLFTPPYPEARSFEAFFILSMIATLMVAYFFLHGAEIALGNAKATSIISGIVANGLSGASPEYIHSFGVASWWVHAIVLLVFMNFLPYSKHMHVLTAIPNVFFRDFDRPVLMERETFEVGNKFGVSQVDEYSWKDLLDSFTCTECGRCQDNCPANLTDKPLNPRELLHIIKDNLNANGKGIKTEGAKTPLIGDGKHSVSEDTIWSCVTCGACMASCPVFIEHIPKLVKLRRHLVEMEAQFPEELLNLFENMEQRSNPWGIAPSERTKWCSMLDLKEYNEETEYLLYVGCAGAFDSRSKQISVALTQILDKAGVSYGILGKEELCCGDSVRRLGNEYLFEKMASENVELFKSKGVTKIITQCPHCFTTLKNDYKQYGIELEVIHHSEMISKLIKDGKIKLDQKSTEKIVFHDSCYLGRHNDVYDAPREVIASTGAQVLEMERNMDKSFCCGAGGGRMWMEEDLGSRINVNRVEQAVEQSPDSICVSCPYCMTMFEDGLKDIQKEDVRVQDIAEVTAHAIKDDL